MQIIKRKILLEDSIDRNYNSPTYGTLTATTFYINIMLTQNIENIGIFTDAEFIENNNLNPDSINSTLRLTGKTVSDYFTTDNKVITGNTQSYLDDVKTYSLQSPYQVGFYVNSEDYINFIGKTISGVDVVTSLSNPITYSFGVDKYDVNSGTTKQSSGILYQDFTGTNITTISYVGEGLNSTNTSLSAITKINDYLFGITSIPEVKSDVFIDRGITNVFEKHMKLSEVTTLGELSRYGNGFFNLTKE